MTAPANCGLQCWETQQARYVCAKPAMSAEEGCGACEDYLDASSNPVQLAWRAVGSRSSNRHHANLSKPESGTTCGCSAGATRTPCTLSIHTLCSPANGVPPARCVGVVWVADSRALGPAQSSNRHVYISSYRHFR